MKLIVCLECSEVRSLDHRLHTCGCRRSGGRYTDDLNAVVFGPCRILGFANGSLAQALRIKPTRPDNGPKFTAFVIPENAPTVRRVDRRTAKAWPEVPRDEKEVL